MRSILFWIFIFVVGLSEASFAYNAFDGGIFRWVLISLSVLNLCLFALLDRTPPLRKAAIYIAAALVWGGLRYAYRWLHEPLDGGDMILFSILVWVDLLLNLATGAFLLRELRRSRPAGQ